MRYMGGTQIVSASTDSTLRLWNTQSYEPVRVYTGHINEKNFVGLGIDEDFIACGSEMSEVLPPSAPMCARQGLHSSKLFQQLTIQQVKRTAFSMCGTVAVMSGYEGVATKDTKRPCMQVFVYFRSMSKPIAKRLFSPPVSTMPSTSGAGPSRPNLQFISAVCWKPMSQTLLAANSQGAIKVLQLTS